MDDPGEVVAAVDSLFAAIREASIPEIQARYLQDPRLLVFLEGPDSKYEGWDTASNAEAWAGILGQIAFHELALGDDVHAGRDGDLGWVAATTRYAYGPKGGDGPDHAAENRGTWILERHDGDWKIVCEHVSFPLPEPYPTG
jgi:ketosteroid isomerase-like protein